MFYLSSEANKKLKEYLSSLDEITEVKTANIVHLAISSHPDIFYCDLIKDFFVGNPKVLIPQYPGDILYNAACTGKYFIHNLKYTDKALLHRAKELGMIPVNVKQGYSKCNIVIVDENSVITSDEGITATLVEAGLNVLKISDKGVNLPGFNQGFIGGASGRYKDTIIFNGNLERHPDYKKITEFIEARGLKIKYFADYPLTDIGSILWGNSAIVNNKKTSI